MGVCQSSPKPSVSKSMNSTLTTCEKPDFLHSGEKYMLWKFKSLLIKKYGDNVSQKLVDNEIALLEARKFEPDKGGNRAIKVENQVASNVANREASHEADLPIIRNN